MALQPITPPVYLGPKNIRDTSATTQTLNTSGHYVAWVVPAPKTGTVDRVHFVAGAVTANGDGLRARIETPSATDGLPSGTLIGGSSEVTIAAVSANAWNRSGAGLAAAVTRGQIVAVKLLSPAGTTYNGVLRTHLTNAHGPGVNMGTHGIVPYVVNAVPTATKVIPGGMTLALEYDDGTTPVILDAIPCVSVANTSFSDASTPDERGNLFQVAFPCRLIGVYHQTLPDGTGRTFDLVLYQGTSTVLETISIDGDISRNLASGPMEHLFDTPIELAANTDYRLVLKPTGGGSISQMQYVIDTSAGGTRLREAAVGGTSWQLTTRADAGAWTDTPDTVACLGLIVDQFDDGAGAGGGLLTHPGMAGGMRG